MKNETQHTWIKEGKFLYMLHQIGYKHGEPQLSNKFYFQVQPDYAHGITDQDAENQANQIFIALTETAAERDRLKEENNQLWIELKALRESSQFDRLKEENERLKKFKDNLESGAEQFARVAKQRDQLKEENEKLKKENVKLKNERKALQSDNSDLRENRIQFHYEERNKLQSLNAELVEALGVAKAYMDVFVIRGEQPLVGEKLNTDLHKIKSLLQKAKDL